MNTQNVNVKTATKESSERWVKTSSLRTDGFVRNIHSRNPFDVIRADVVLARMEIQAILDAHQQAVSVAMGEIERLASTRVMTEGVSETVLTGKLLAAAFNHD